MNTNLGDYSQRNFLHLGIHLIACCQHSEFKLSQPQRPKFQPRKGGVGGGGCIRLKRGATNHLTTQPTNYPTNSCKERPVNPVVTQTVRHTQILRDTEVHSVPKEFAIRLYHDLVDSIPRPRFLFLRDSF